MFAGMKRYSKLKKFFGFFFGIVWPRCWASTVPGVFNFAHSWVSKTKTRSELWWWRRRYLVKKWMTESFKNCVGFEQSRFVRWNDSPSKVKSTVVGRSSVVGAADDDDEENTRGVDVRGDGNDCRPYTQTMHMSIIDVIDWVLSFTGGGAVGEWQSKMIRWLHCSQQLSDDE